MMTTTLNAAELLNGTTPGEWQLGVRDHNEQRTVVADSGRLVCVCAHGGVESLLLEMEYNGRLIAAAPALAARVVELEATLNALADFACPKLDRLDPLRIRVGAILKGDSV